VERGERRVGIGGDMADQTSDTSGPERDAKWSECDILMELTWSKIRGWFGISDRLLSQNFDWG